jgi:hypothetical protein
MNEKLSSAVLILKSNSNQYGSFETNSRIPLPEKAGPQQAQKQVDRLHAWYQPPQPADIYPLPYHFSGQTIKKVIVFHHRSRFLSFNSFNQLNISISKKHH